MPSVIRVDQPAAGVMRLLIDRPDKRNAIDFRVREALLQELHAARNDAKCRAIVLGGIGGIFSAGGDVPSMSGLSEEQARERMRHIHALCRMVASLRLPVISSVEGFCAGAAVGLALLGDLIIVGRDTKLLFPFFKLGLAPDWGMLRTLPARVGLCNARRLMLSSEPISGADAFALGFADEYVDEGDVMDAAVGRASAMAKLPSEAFARMKQRLSQPVATLAAELEREEDDQAFLLLSEDFREGYSAFREKRPPDFNKKPI